MFRFLPRSTSSAGEHQAYKNWFIDDQAFSQWYDLSPFPPFPPHNEEGKNPPLSRQYSMLDRRHKRSLGKRDNLLTAEERREWEGCPTYDGKKAWYSMNNSILSRSNPWRLPVVKGLYYIQFQSFCPDVWIGSPHPLLRKQVCLPPPPLGSWD